MNNLGDKNIEAELNLAVLNNDQDFFDKYFIMVKENLPFVQLKYSQEAQYVGHNKFSELCRGRIYFCDRENQQCFLAALPLKKFYNYGERSMFPTDSTITKVMEKMDGSLAIVWWNFVENKWVATTQGGIKGGFDRQNILDNTLEYTLSSAPYMDKGFTYLFEFTGTANQHVVSYRYEARLIYIGMTNNHSGKFWWYFERNYNGFRTPKVYNISSITDIETALDSFDKNNEGFVAIFGDDSVWKFKGDKYLEYHKFLFNVTKKALVKFVRDKWITDRTKIIDAETEFILSVPEEFHDEIAEWIDEIWTTDPLANEFNLLLQETYDSLPQNSDRKTVALFVKNKNPKMTNLVVSFIFDDKIPYYIFAAKS